MLTGSIFGERNLPSDKQKLRASEGSGDVEMKKMTDGDAASVLQLSLVDETCLTRHGVPA